MGNNVKRCTQCGVLKAVEEFRAYTYSIKAGTSGRYGICKNCENINTRYKYLCNPLHAPHPEEKEKIEMLYSVLASKGLRVPLIAGPRPVVEKDSLVDKLLTFHNVVPSEISTIPTIVEAPVEICVDELPDELVMWLHQDMAVWQETGLSPEFLQETIYESLKVKYRPRIGLDTVLYIPLYDDTYKEVLNAILRRFDEYEEKCAISTEE